MPTEQERNETSPSDNWSTTPALNAIFDGVSAKARDDIKIQIIRTKELRVCLDMQLQCLKLMRKTREISLAITKVEEAIMWLGMNLKELNRALPEDQRAPSPYPSSYDPKTAHVEPPADGLKL